MVLECCCFRKKGWKNKSPNEAFIGRSSPESILQQGRKMEMYHFRSFQGYLESHVSHTTNKLMKKGILALNTHILILPKLAIFSSFKNLSFLG